MSIFEKYKEREGMNPEEKEEYLEASRKLAVADLGLENANLLYAIADAYQRYGEVTVNGKLALLGYFCGDCSKDRELISRLVRLGADDPKSFPIILRQIARSRAIAMGKLGERYPEISPKDMAEKIAKGEIEDPYDLKSIEEDLTGWVVPKIPSITIQPLELSERPGWWNDYSIDFQSTLDKYIHFPQK